jgi:hypothetical protein
LHAEKRANAANGAGGETGEKIGGTPSDGGGQTEYNGIGHLFGLGLFYFEAEGGHDFLQIFPNFAFGGGVAKEISGMVGGEHLVAAEIQPLPAKLRDAAIGLKKSLRGGAAKANDGGGLQGVELAE